MAPWGPVPGREREPGWGGEDGHRPRVGEMGSPGGYAGLVSRGLGARAAAAIAKGAGAGAAGARARRLTEGAASETDAQAGAGPPRAAANALCRCQQPASPSAGAWGEGGAPRGVPTGCGGRGRSAHRARPAW